MSQTILFNHPSFLSKPASQIVVIQDSLQLFGSSNLCAIGHDLVSRRIKRNMISTIQRTNVPADLRHPTTGFPACSRTSNPDPICLSFSFILITGSERSRKMKGKSVSKKIECVQVESDDEWSTRNGSVFIPIDFKGELEWIGGE